jgi:hypothetical protein
MAKIKYDRIPPDAIIDIQVSGTFYRGIVDLLTMLSNTVPLEEFKAILEKLKSNNPAESMIEFNVNILMSLIYEIEKKAKSQNKTKEEEVEIPDEKLTDSSQIPSPQV